MSKIVKSTKRPLCAVAIEQSKEVWLTSDDAKEPAATALEIAQATIPMPEGNGRRMLRQVPAGIVRIEVKAGKPDLEIGVSAMSEPLEEKLEEVRRVG